MSKSWVGASQRVCVGRVFERERERFIATVFTAHLPSLLLNEAVAMQSDLARPLHALAGCSKGSEAVCTLSYSNNLSAIIINHSQNKMNTRRITLDSGPVPLANAQNLKG